MTAENPTAVGRAPDFLIIGAQKSGTSSIAGALRRVDRFYVTPKKELHYFQRFDPTTEPASWLRYMREFADAPVGAFVGEATPNYLSSTVAPARIHAVTPETRLIASLRNPVDRAYSAYWHARRFGIVPRSVDFAEFVERDTREFGAEWTDVIGDGCYSRQLRCYLRQFRGDQVHVLLFDDLIDDSASAMTGIIRHIHPSDEHGYREAFPHVNPGHTRYLPRLSRRILNPRGKAPRSLPWARRILVRRDEVAPPMDPKVRGMLTEIYRPWNRDLEALIGRSMAAWGT